MKFGFQSATREAIFELARAGADLPRPLRSLTSIDVEVDLQWESDYDGGWLYTIPGDLSPSLWADQEGNLKYVRLPRWLREIPFGVRSLKGTGPESGVYMR